MPNFKILKAMLIAGLLAMAGCAGTPAPSADGVPVINSFNGDSSDYASLAGREECNDRNSLVNRRQIMVTSMAVQSAWFYCLRYAGGAYFPEEETEKPVGKFPE